MNHEFRVGLAVIISLIVLFTGLSWLKGWSYSQDEKIYVLEFENTLGLLTGDPVFVRGVKVGKVDTIEPQPKFVAVRVTLDNQAVIFSDAHAEIGMLELLAGKKIEIYPGISGVEMKTGGVVQGKIGADIPRMLNQVNEVSDDLKSLIRNLNQTFQGINQIVSNERFKENSLSLIENLNTTSKNLAVLTSGLSKNSPKIDSMFTKLNLLITTTQLTIADLRPGMKDVLGKTSESMTEINKTFTQLNKAIDRLNDNKSVINQALYDEKFAVKLNSTIDSLNLMMNHLRTKPIKLDVDIW